MSKRALLYLALCAVAIIAIMTPACTGKASNNLAEPSYSPQITENILLAINAGDYAAFSKDFDDSMRKALPAESFQKQFSDGILGKIGEYQGNSKRFFQSSSQAQYTTVVYYAVYSGEPGAVLVQISFRMVNGQPLVSGIFFNSPKLRG
jgi:hypothetical protein